MGQYQLHEIEADTLVRPRYGVIKAAYIPSSTGKSFSLHNTDNADDCSDENRLFRVVAPSIPYSMENISKPFDSLFVKVESDNPDDIGELLLSID